MKAPTTIPRAGTTDTATDYQELLRLGLKHCQQLGGDLWTDFNEHDPGVTILEQLCFALTDLSYRASFDIKDILASVPKEEAPEDSLYTGDKALSSDPVTDSDYRILLYDRIDGLKNAWVRKVEGQAQGIEGLQEVLIETREDKEKPEEIEAIRKETVKWMRWFRNLGEDVHAVRILTVQPIQVQATIRIAANVDPAGVLAQVLFAIQNHLVPFPSIVPIDTLINTQSPDEIWNGPRLDHGALDKQSLKELRQTIHVSEIAKIILQVEGVKQVKGLLVGETGTRLSNADITVRPGCVPRLDPPILRSQSSYGINIELEGGFKSLVDSRAVAARINGLQIGMRQQIEAAARSFKMLSYLKVPEGKGRNIKDYISLQHQFPAVYGLGRNSMANTLVEGGHKLQLRSDNRRQARIRQLRAFLLFFEQPLADYLAQLSHVADLFSLKEDLPHTYFYQPLACDPDPENLADVLMQRRADPRPPLVYYLVYMLDAHNEIVFVTRRLLTEADARERRRQIIESGGLLHNYRTTRSASGEVRLTLHNSDGTILAMGQQHYTSVEAARVGAGNLQRYMANPRHTSELEQRVRSLRREELGVQVIDHESRVVLVGKPVPNREELERRIVDILASGIHPANYKIRPWPRGGFHLQLYNDRGELIADGEEIFLTEIDANAGGKTLAALLRRLEQSGSERARHLRRLPDSGVSGESPLRNYHEGLKRIAELTDHDYLRRRNRILDHLLARFGESFDDGILERLDLRPFGEKDDFFREMIRWKIEFLRGYVVPDESPMPSLSSGRALGFDYGNHEISVSGFERRVTLLLGIHGHSDGGTYHQQQMAEHSDPGYYYLEKSVRPLDPEHLALEKQPSRSTPPTSLQREQIAGPWIDGEPDLRDLHHYFVYSSADSAVLRQLLNFGGNCENYHVQHSHGEFRVLFFPPQSAHATEIHHTHSRNGAENTIDDLVRYFQGLRKSVVNSYAGERMHVVEHVLLRPHTSGRQAGHPAQNSGGVPDDFYSYRVSVVLPNWPVRFQSDEFKLYAEQLMFENAPAHLAIDCFWLSVGQMKEFEGLYSQWKTLRREIEEAEVPDAGRVASLDQSAERLRAMIVKLHEEQPPEGPAKPEAGKA
jgi:hypothetical protein